MKVVRYLKLTFPDSLASLHSEQLYLRNRLYIVINSLILNILLGILTISFSTSNLLAVKSNQKDSVRKSHLEKHPYRDSANQIQSEFKTTTHYDLNIVLSGHCKIIVAKMKSSISVYEDSEKRKLTYIITAFPNYNGGYNPVREITDRHAIQRRLLACLMKIVLRAGHLGVNITLEVVVTEDSEGQVEWIKGVISHPLIERGRTFFYYGLKRQYYNIWSTLPLEEEGLFVNPIVYSVHALIGDNDLLHKSTIPFMHSMEAAESNNRVSVFNDIKGKQKGKKQPRATECRCTTGYVSGLRRRYYQETTSENIKVTIANDQRIPVFCIHPI